MFVPASIIKWFIIFCHVHRSRRFDLIKIYIRPFFYPALNFSFYFINTMTEILFYLCLHFEALNHFWNNVSLTLFFIHISKFHFKCKSTLQRWSYWREHLKYVWNVYCVATNHRWDLHTTDCFTVSCVISVRRKFCLGFSKISGWSFHSRINFWGLSNKFSYDFLKFLHFTSQGKLFFVEKTKGNLKTKLEWREKSENVSLA